MVEVPLSVDETKPVTLLYCPSVVPITLTLKVQLPPAASDPPVNAMVLVDAVVVNVPPLHWGELLSTIESPIGKISVNAIPLKA